MCVKMYLKIVVFKSKHQIAFFQLRAALLGAPKKHKARLCGGRIQIPNNQIQVKNLLMSEPPICATAASSPRRCITKTRNYSESGCLM